MNSNNTMIGLVRLPVQQYLGNRIPAAELVRIVDDLVAQDRLDGLSTCYAELVARLHEALALYVADEPTRRQEPGIYIGDEELRRKAMEFLVDLESLAQTDPQG